MYLIRYFLVYLFVLTKESMKRNFQKHARIHYKNIQTTHGYNTVPWLNLSGAWLEMAGFPISTAIMVTVFKKKIVIKKIGSYARLAQPTPQEIFLPDAK